jgi:precorrin-6B methylase 2
VAEREDLERAALERCLREPGYTPPVRALPALLAALAEQGEKDAERLERALVRAGDALLEPMLRALNDAPPARRAPLLSLFVRLAGTSADERLLSPLLGALAGTPLEQRLAARGLGKLGDARGEPALLAVLESAALPEQRAIVDALGLVGGAPSRDRLAAFAPDDPELERRRSRAVLLLERRSAREQPGTLRWQSALGRSWDVALRCRRGLAEILSGELSTLGLSPRVRSPERVDVRVDGTLEALQRARTALDFALIVPLPESSREPPEEVIATALARPDVLEAFARWTEGVPRFRVEWTSGGHHRALSWALARELGRRTRALVNDSQRAPWTVFAPPDAQGELLLAPHQSPDPRFSYRQRDVPAASHPTIAAALARSAGVRPDDIVWDPFVGSGLELIERARLGPYQRLIGSDISEDALAAARANLDAAGVSASLSLGDARSFDPGPISLIISNPPMGRRVARDSSLHDLLSSIVDRAARLLVPGGRLVWLSPLDKVTRDRAVAAGLSVIQGPRIDMGGFEARLQTLLR